MKRLITMATMVMMAALVVPVAARGMDFVHPEIGAPSNTEKGKHAMKPLDAAEKSFWRAFPRHQAEGEWRVSEHGYHRWYAIPLKQPGKRTDFIELTVTHEGKIFFKTETGDDTPLR